MPLPEFLTRKAGPLPMWAWGGLLLGVLLIVTIWRRNQADTTSAEVTTGTVPDASTDTPYVFILPSQTAPVVQVVNPTATRPTAPSGGGRTYPPGTRSYPTRSTTFPNGKTIPANGGVVLRSASSTGTSTQTTTGTIARIIRPRTAAL